MPRYRYKATNKNGRTVWGEKVAPHETELFKLLKEEEKYLISAKIQNRKRDGKPLNAAALADFCRQLGTLLEAGIPLAKALTMTAQNESIKYQHRALYTELLRLIRQGMPLSAAMEELGNTFPPMLIHLFRISESAGNMYKTANQMAVQYDKEGRLNQKIKSSLAYSKLLGGLIVIVVIVLTGYVLPQFESLFTLMDELPTPTRILYNITNIVRSSWYLLILGVLMVTVGIGYITSRSSVRIVLDRWKVHMPFLGKLWKVIYTARFARTLSSLYGAGIPIAAAMEIAKSAVGNTYVEVQFAKAKEVIGSGGNLSDAVRQIDGFASKLAVSIQVGEEAGSLERMLETTAEQLEYESETAANRMVSYVEPAMIIIMAMVIGFVMIAVMMPIYASYSAIEASAYN